MAKELRSQIDMTIPPTGPQHLARVADVEQAITDNLFQFMTPDFNAKQPISASDYTVTNAGFIWLLVQETTQRSLFISVNDNVVAGASNLASSSSNTGCMAPVKPGDIVNCWCVPSIGYAEVYFVPPVKVPAPVYPAAFMPDESQRISVGNPYTVTQTGFVRAEFEGTPITLSVSLNGVIHYRITPTAGDYGTTPNIPVKAGDVVTFGAGNFRYFFPPIAVVLPLQSAGSLTQPVYMNNGVATPTRNVIPTGLNYASKISITENGGGGANEISMSSQAGTWTVPTTGGLFEILPDTWTRKTVGNGGSSFRLRITNQSGPVLENILDTTRTDSGFDYADLTPKQYWVCGGAIIEFYRSGGSGYSTTRIRAEFTPWSS